MTYFIFGVLLGIILGRLYGWAKYHNPEFQEMIKAKTARARAERMQWEARAERYAGEIDDELERRQAR